MTEIATTAEAYFERYKNFYDNGQLVQGSWNSERDGRHVACALGVLGDDVGSASQCPASVMPRWLAQMVPWFFDNQEEQNAYDWGLAFAAELKRLNGNVPFRVVYDWQARYVTQMGIDAAVKRERDPSSHAAVQQLHKDALAGVTHSKEEWREALKKSNAYANANAYADAYANADANAYAYAYAYAYAKQKAVSILANGMVDCLRQVTA